MSICDIVAERGYSPKKRISKLLKDKNLDDYLTRLPNGELTESEFSHVIDIYAEAYLITKEVEWSDHKDYAKVEDLLNRIEKVLRDSSRYKQILQDSREGVITMKPEGNSPYKSTTDLIDNYFGDQKNERPKILGFAVSLARDYAFELHAYYNTVKMKDTDTITPKKRIESARLHMVSKYDSVHIAISSIPEIIAQYQK